MVILPVEPFRSVALVGFAGSEKSPPGGQRGT